MGCGAIDWAAGGARRGQGVGQGMGNGVSRMLGSGWSEWYHLPPIGQGTSGCYTMVCDRASLQHSSGGD